MGITKKIALGLFSPLILVNCLNQTDGYTGTYMLADPSQAATTGATSSGSGGSTSPVGSPPAPACTPGTPVNDGTNFRSYWNGMESPGGTCTTTTTGNFKGILHERVKSPHRIVYYTSTSLFPKPVGFSNLPSGFTDPPSNEATQKALSIAYLQDMSQGVAVQWNTWHTFAAMALMGTNPGRIFPSATYPTVDSAHYNGAAACGTDMIYDYYGGNCMSPPGNGYPLVTTGYPRLFNTDSSLKGSEGSLGGCSSNCQLTTYNREHSFPKSWFAAGSSAVNNPSAGSYCYNGNSDSSYDSGKNWDYRAFVDQHHLRPTQQTANTARSNWSYGIVNTIANNYAGNGVSTASGAAAKGPSDITHTFTTPANPVTGGKSGTAHYANIQAAATAVSSVGTFCTGISAAVCPTTGTCTSANNSGCPETCVPPSATTVFEPPDHVKGNLARNIFYMATRYYQEDTCWATSDGTNKAHIKVWLQCLLLRWHQQDPPDAQEVAQNDLIHRIQGNRNPFIDHPTWVETVINNGGF